MAHQIAEVALVSGAAGAEVCDEHDLPAVHVLWADGQVWTFEIRGPGAIDLEMERRVCSN